MEIKMNMSSESKLVLKVSIFSAVFTFILFMLANYFINRSWNPFASSGKSQVFTAEGSSSVKATPDEAQVSFAVTITAKELEDAKNQANTKTNTIVNDLKNAGISQDDIKTSAYTSYPNYIQTDSLKLNVVVEPIPQPSLNMQTIVSYTVSENVEITIHEISKANDIIDLATKDGAENISGPNFTFSESLQKSLNEKARAQAIDDAKQNAGNLAKAAGIRLGRIVNVQENGTPYPTPMMARDKAQGKAGGSTSTQINPGENTVTETVTLSYETW